jgi:lipopolysaccharide export system permease protein
VKIIHRYVTREILRNVSLCSAGFCFLFLIFDFFDRVDNLLTEDTTFFTGLSYFLYKIPLIFNITLPVAMLVGTMFTIGLLSKNSEITAMRAAGMKVFWIAKPVLVTAIILSFFSIFVSETIVPYATRRTREIYNIDIKEKHKTGTYSRNDFWWRGGDTFFSANMFDSRDNSLLKLSKFELNPDFSFKTRTDSERAQWVNPRYGWTMERVTKYNFGEGDAPQMVNFKSLPLTIGEKPQDFYTAKTDPHTMSFLQLRRFIEKQLENGISTIGYKADLYAKLAFPFVIFFSSLVVLPFALKPGRSGSMAVSFIAGIVIGFTYFAVHSFSLAMGRAEIWPPVVAAWMANVVMGVVGLILNLGAESPS